MRQHVNPEELQRSPDVEIMATHIPKYELVYA
jgi:hypothetical protein